MTPTRDSDEMDCWEENDGDEKRWAAETAEQRQMRNEWNAARRKEREANTPAKPGED